MNARLHAELLRLYAPEPGAVALPPGDNGPSRVLPPLTDGHGRVRALVLEARGPEAWRCLAGVCQALCGAHGLPAPAIAVNGLDGLQLWISLAQPVSADEALALGAGLSQVAAGAAAASGASAGSQRTGSAAAAAPAAPAGPVPDARWVPGPVGATGRWAAFIAPDLAAVMTEEPWLDLPPNPDGQAALLAGLQSATWEALCAAAGVPAAPGVARAGVQPAVSAGTGAAGHVSAAVGAAAARSAAPAVLAAASAQPAPQAALDGQPGPADPRAFLQAVMQDPRAPLALRVDAARALLAHSAGR